MRAAIEPRRLIMDPFNTEDVEVALGWFGDPLVMRSCLAVLTSPRNKLEQGWPDIRSTKQHMNLAGAEGDHPMIRLSRQC